MKDELASTQDILKEVLRYFESTHAQASQFLDSKHAYYTLYDVTRGMLERTILRVSQLEKSTVTEEAKRE